MSTIEECYNLAKDTASNCNEHVPVLAEYAEKCTSIVEFGVKEMITTWAFIKGLRFNKKKKRHLICVDSNEKPSQFDKIATMASKGKITMEFVLGRSETVDIPKVDMILIDTHHFYGQLMRELEKHHTFVKKHIAILNTVVDGKYGEIVRMCYHHDITDLQQYGFEPSEICKGLIPAIDDFIANHREWKIEKVYPNNNGLTILSRIENQE